MDKQWIVENPHQGISGTRGDYVVIPALERWRPPEPSELVGEEFRAADRFDPVEIPDLSFPAPGSFNLSVEGIVEMRRFLVDNPDAEHDYSFGEQRTNITRAPPELVPGSDQELDDVPDRLKGAELYVNGQHLTEAHTDNAGEGGQGPLELSFQPPQEDVVQARYGQQYVGLLQKIGVPVEPLVKTINAQLPTIYAQEDFDMYAMAWSLGVNVTHLLQLYSSEGADLDEEIGTQVSNPMEYTGADDLIFEDGSLMDFSERVPIVKQIEARIYHDAPTNVTDIATLLEPTSDEFTGWVGTIGGVITNEDSYLNIARTE
jgi:peptide/nickel transport system substrate-binding protein